MNKKRIFKVLSSILLIATVILLGKIYDNKNKEEKIYLNSNINEENIEEKENNNEEKSIENIVEEEANLIEIMSLGNLIIHQSQIDGAKNSIGYDFSPSFQYVKNMISESDISIGILEGALAGGQPTGYPCFNSPDEVLDALNDSGLDIINYANNHIYDYHDEGLQRTIQVTKEKGLDVLGVKSTEEEKNYLIKEIDRIKIGFISYAYETAMQYGNISINSNVVSSYSENLINTFNYNNLENFYAEMANEIENMKSEGAQFIITSMHWGEEYNTYIEYYQSDMARRLNELGVDIILGGHPHVIQPYELITNESGHSTFVLYSQGNTLSNQSEEEIGIAESEDGILAKFTLEEKDGDVYLKEYNIIPTWVSKEAKGDGTYYHKIIPLKEALANPSEYNITDVLYEKLKIS